MLVENNRTFYKSCVAKCLLTKQIDIALSAFLTNSETFIKYLPPYFIISINLTKNSVINKKMYI